MWNRDIKGSHQLFELLGESPNFHDAEILQLHLDRAGESWIRLKLPPVFPSKSSDSASSTATITFSLDSVVDIDLTEFNHQNVVHDLIVEQQDDCFQLTLVPCFGLNGTITAERISVAVTFD